MAVLATPRNKGRRILSGGLRMRDAMASKLVL